MAGHKHHVTRFPDDEEVWAVECEEDGCDHIVATRDERFSGVPTWMITPETEVEIG